MKNQEIDSRGSAGLFIIIGLVAVTITATAFFITSGKSAGKQTAAAPTHNCVSQSLSEGASGVCVKDVQTLLNWKVFGINQPAYLPVDGQFTASTVAVVKQLQTKLKVPASGTVDSTIWQVICQGGDAPSWWAVAAADAICKG